MDLGEVSLNGTKYRQGEDGVFSPIEPKALPAAQKIRILRQCLERTKLDLQAFVDEEGDSFAKLEAIVSIRDIDRVLEATKE